MSLRFPLLVLLSFLMACAPGGQHKVEIVRGAGVGQETSGEQIGQQERSALLSVLEGESRPRLASRTVPKRTSARIQVPLNEAVLREVRRFVGKERAFIEQGEQLAPGSSFAQLLDITA